ncbi:MAG: hypothetical protein KKA31_05830 [Candidatus Margulisbacteria bacterium]|nr:hypothetical protein [Candidatus Margulisiibacteriota bacterium]
MTTRAKKPFRFYTTSSLVEITGQKAYHLKDFIKLLKTIDSSCIFYHIHHSFREYTFAPGQYSNDFARWVEEDLEEARLAERLASIDVSEFTDLETLRAKLVEFVEDHLMSAVEIRKAAPGREFYFLRGTSIITPTRYEVNTLDEFTSALEKVGMRSLYFHFFDARLRLGRKTNDFSNWIRQELGEPEIAVKINKLDPYFITMDQLKQEIIALCQKKDIKMKAKGLLGFIKNIAGNK